MSGLAPPEGHVGPEVPGVALPTVVVGGYLGAGKTTLVNRLLREAAARGAGEGGRRIAVLVNDFGEVSIDADLIVGAEGGVLSLAGGCVCCSFGADLVGALAQVAARQPPPHVVLVETSGVGLPGAVARTAALAPQVRVEQIVVVADAAAVRAQAAARYVGGTVRRQLQEADLVLLGKVDLVQPQEVHELETWLREEVGVALPCVAMPPPPGSEGAEDLVGLVDLVLGPSAASPAAGGVAGEGVPAPTPGRAEPVRRVALADGFAPRPLRPEAEPAAQRFVTTTLRFDRAVDTAALGAELLAQGVLRAKGVLLDLADGWQEVQVAGGRVHRRPAAPPAVARHRGDGRDGASHGGGGGGDGGDRAGGDGGDGGNGTHDAVEAAGRLVAISLRHG